MRVRTWLVAGLAMTISVSAVAQPRSFAIPAQPVAGALLAYMRATGLSIAADAALTRDRASRGVQGEMEPQAALDRLLAGSGLVGQIQGGTVVLAPVPPEVRLNAGALELPQMEVEASPGAPPTAAIGTLPPAYPGGQVARGGRVGLLGNRDYMETPFSTTSYTDEFIRNRQARVLADVLQDDPSVRAGYSRYNSNDRLLLRGFSIFGSDASIDGLPGLLSTRRTALDSFERIEVLRGPNALLSGAAPGGNIAGTLNYVPKRAGDVPINRFTGSYYSDSNIGGAFDIGRRFGAGKEWGVRFNGAYRDGSTPLRGQSEQFGNTALSLDYRGERLRVTADGGYSNISQRVYSNYLTLAPGAALPRTPRPNTTFATDWTFNNTELGYGLLRAEYDLLANTTIGFGYGLSYGVDQGAQVLLGGLSSTGDATTFPAFSALVNRNQSADLSLRSRLETGPLRHEFAIIGNIVQRRQGSAFVFGEPTGEQSIYSPLSANPPDFRRANQVPRTTSQVVLSSIAFADTISALDGRVQLVAGGRLQRIEVENYALADGARTSRYDQDALTPAFALTVRPWQPVSLYANYIEGLTQGPTAPVTARNAGTIFPPALARQYEVGMKLDYQGFGAQIALFQITQQSGGLDPASNVYGLVGQQRNRGAELLVFGEAAPGLRLLGGGSLIDARLTRTADGVSNGKRAPGVPNFLLNASAEWDPAILPATTLFGRVTYTGNAYLDSANTQQVPSWAKLDIGARYALVVRDLPVVLRAGIENVTGARYWQAAGENFLGLGAPRTYLLSTSFSF